MDNIHNKTIAFEKLDVEDEDQRFQRIQTTLERLNMPTVPEPSPSPLKLPMEHSKPDHVSTSQLLARVQAFLPEIEASNAVLEQRRQGNPSSIDIEHVDESADQYIEMNLGLGLFEQRGPRAPNSTGDEQSDSSSMDSSGSEASDLDEDSASDSEASSESGSDLENDTPPPNGP